MKKINHRKVFKQMFYFILSLIILFSLLTFAILQMNTFGAEATGERLERMNNLNIIKMDSFKTSITHLLLQKALILKK